MITCHPPWYPVGYRIIRIHSKFAKVFRVSPKDSLSNLLLSSRLKQKDNLCRSHSRARRLSKPPTLASANAETDVQEKSDNDCDSPFEALKAAVCYHTALVHRFAIN